MRRHFLIIVLTAFAPACTAPGGIIFDFNTSSFAANATSNGHTFQFNETFEEGIIPGSQSTVLDDSLSGGIPNVNGGTGWGFASGLNATGLSVQSNTLGGSATTTSPRGPEGLMMAGLGFGGTSSIGMFNNFVTDSLDLVFAVGQGAVGFNVLKEGGPGSVFINVYNSSNLLVAATFLSPADTVGSNFLGLTMTGGDTIGRINISRLTSERVGVDNIQMWATIPSPGALGLLVVAGLCGCWRRRRVA